MKEEAMSIMEFEVYPEAQPPRVILNGEFYGDYLGPDLAKIDAVDAAEDRRKLGDEARVWVREHQSAARIF